MPEDTPPPKRPRGRQPGYTKYGEPSKSEKLSGPLSFHKAWLEEDFKEFVFREAQRRVHGKPLF